MKAFVTQAIMPVIDYGCEVTTRMNSASKRRLDTALAMSIRTALGVGANTKQRLVYDAIGILPIWLRWRYRCASFGLKILASPEHVLKRALSQAAHHGELYVTTRWAELTGKCLQQLLTQTSLRRIMKNPVHSRLVYDHLHSNLAVSVMDFPRKRSVTKLKALAISKQHLFQLKRNLQPAREYYTDGSLHENGNCGVGVSSQALRVSKRITPTSITHAELIAVRLALEHACSVGVSPVVIHTDSLAACCILRNPVKNRHLPDSVAIHQLAREISVTINWIPSHTGLKGNDLADELANLGAEMEFVSISCQPPLSYRKAQLRGKCWSLLSSLRNSGSSQEAFYTG